MDLIHYHLPFCAGHSIRSAMMRFSKRQMNRNPPAEEVIEVKQNGYVYQNPRIQKGNFRLTEEQKSQRLEVTFVRHPYSRFVSNWNKLKNSVREKEDEDDGTIKRITENGMIIRFQRRFEEHSLPLDKLISKYLEKYADLNDFLHNGDDDIDLLNSLKISNNFRSMSFFCEGEWDKFNKIVKCEDGIRQGLVGLNNEYNLFDFDERFNVPNLNKFPKIFDNEQLDQQSKDRIYELHNPDFKYLGYTR